MASFRTALLATAASALSLAAAPAALANGLSFTNKTTSNGLGSNDVRGVFTAQPVSPLVELVLGQPPVSPLVLEQPLWQLVLKQQVVLEQPLQRLLELRVELGWSSGQQMV